jgi:hypothetical protein
MKRLRVFAGVGFLCLWLVGCGGDESQAGGPGGRCISPDACWEVIDPPGYSIVGECSLAGGTWESGTCPPIQYERRCTQDTMVSTNNGPEMTVRYVYYYMHSAGFACLGTEEIL